MFRKITRRGRGVATVGSEEGKLMRCRKERILTIIACGLNFYFCIGNAAL
jgi:hypothetical protein